MARSWADCRPSHCASAAWAVTRPRATRISSKCFSVSARKSGSLWMGFVCGLAWFRQLTILCLATSEAIVAPAVSSERTCARVSALYAPLASRMNELPGLLDLALPWGGPELLPRPFREARLVGPGLVSSPGVVAAQRPGPGRRSPRDGSIAPY